MRIAINCRSFLNKNYTGIGRYTYNLVQSLSRLDSENEYILYAAKRPFDKKKQLPQIPASNFKLKVDYLKRGIDKTIKNLDIYHSPSPDVISMKDANIVVSIHDLVYKAFPEAHTETTLKLTDKQIKSFINEVSMVICSSDNTLRDVKKYFSIDEKKLRRVYLGVDHNEFYRIDTAERMKAEKELKTIGVEYPFFLYVGTLEPRKNLKNLLIAFENLKSKKQFSGKLVVVGMKGWLNDGIEKLVNDLGIRDDIINLGYISNVQLRYLYNCCKTFVFPSFYEGFGYPIIEAFSCGAPVITSNSSSCPEIAGDCALTVDPNNSDEIAQSLKFILNEDSLRKNMIEKGLVRSKEFNYHQTAKETLDVYREVFHLNKRTEPVLQPVTQAI